MKVERKGNELLITIPINSELTVSPTGKTKQVASSHGNMPTTVQIEGKSVIVGLNAYIPVR